MSSPHAAREQSVGVRVMASSAASKVPEQRYSGAMRTLFISVLISASVAACGSDDAHVVDQPVDTGAAADTATQTDTGSAVDSAVDAVEDTTSPAETAPSETSPSDSATETSDAADAPVVCTAIACTSDTTCTALGCGTCNMGSGHCRNP